MAISDARANTCVSMYSWVPGEDWPLAGTHRGHAGIEDVLQKASGEVETTYPRPPEFVAQGDRVLVIGVATGKIKATNNAFKDEWVFDITVRDGKLTRIHSISYDPSKWAAISRL